MHALRQASPNQCAIVADAQDQGYRAKIGSGRKPYHGYFYKILTKQGPHTPAGAYNYSSTAA